MLNTDSDFHSYTNCSPNLSSHCPSIKAQHNLITEECFACVENYLHFLDQ